MGFLFFFELIFLFIFLFYFIIYFNRIFFRICVYENNIFYFNLLIIKLNIEIYLNE